MSDQNDPGNGFWQASDGNWYPPESHPDYVAPPFSERLPPTTDLPLAPSLPAPSYAPPGPQFVPPAPTGPGAPSALPPSPAALAIAGGQPNQGGKQRRPVLAALVVAGAAVAAVIAFAGGGNNDDGLVTGVVEAVGTPRPAVEELERPTPAGPDTSPDDVPAGTGPGSRTDPLAYDALVPVEWNVFGDADGSVWNVRLSPPRDITADVLAANDFNDPPPEGAIFAGFDVELTLASANKEPLSTGLNVDWEILGGATNSVYDEVTFDDLFGCGVVDHELDRYAEVFVGGTLTGVVCIPLPAEDLTHPDTQLAMNMRGDRVAFVAEGAKPAPAEITSRGQIADSIERGYDASVPVTFDVFGDADGSVWNIRLSAPRDVTVEVLEANDFNDPPPDGVIFAGFDAEMTLASADKEPLAPGFNLSWEIAGGATSSVYDSSTISDLFGCGSFDEQFDNFAEVFVGGTVSGVVCVPLPAEDLAHPDTRVSVNLQGDRVLFVDGAETPPPAELQPNGGPSALRPFAPLDEPIDLVWDVFGDAEGSVWTTTVGAWSDITDEVVAANTFNDPPLPGLVYAGFEVELSLVSASKQPLSSGFNVSWEILGGATLRVYDETSFVDLFGCGSFDGEFDHFDEVFVGGTLDGTVCVPLPIEDFSHPDTRISLTFPEGRVVFGPN